MSNKRVFLLYEDHTLVAVTMDAGYVQDWLADDYFGELGRVYDELLTVGKDD